MTRRAFLAHAAALGTVGLALSSCTVPIAPRATQTAKGGGTLRVGRLEDISLNGVPHLLAPANFQLSNLVYDTLIVYDRQLVPQPRLATGWTWSPDYRQLSLQLRPGVKFHTGRAFTSEDAKFNLERLRDPAVGSQFRGYANAMDISATAPDKLVISYEQPIRSSFDAITLTFMADPQTIDQSRTGQNFVGTGPFVFEEWVQGDHLHVRRNAEYWQPGKPSLDRVELRVFQDQQQALVALESGAIDWMVGVAAADARRLQSDPGYQVLQNAAGSSYLYLGLDV
ncbi:MAG TPA: ABC transporter substrate-binding protein, partial [Ktedonobacterales bacterium]